MFSLKHFVIGSGITLSIALASCTSTSNDIAFEVRSDSCAYMIPNWDGDTVYAIATYKMVWPTHAIDTNLSALHDSLLMCAFDTITTDFDQAAEHFFSKAQPEGQTVALCPATMEDARKADFCNELTSQSYVALLTPTLLVMGIDNYGYTIGAAHGYGTSTYINYSITNKCILTLDNLFDKGQLPEVLETVRTSARDLYPHSMINIDDITLVGNFRLTPQKIVFVYQPYDIAPYSMGVVEIPVNIYDLFETLSPLGISALSL